ncbi:MAG TPA: alpha/beta hydrolase [Vicinamibacterales bacterium]|nr:alpha/beta hydrolase [Vicinamibacterales bacterium]
MRTSSRLALAVFAGLAVTAAFYKLPEIAAGGLLWPSRRTDIAPLPDGCRERTWHGAGVELQGWGCDARGSRRGTIIYLHGVADNRSSSAGVIRRYVSRGFDVLAYDSRRHGASTGEVCTYGFYEKQDLRAVVDSASTGPVVLIGTSLGAAVALQAAADDPRISRVVAAEIFSDLETVARERAPFLLPSWVVRKAFDLAEQRGSFKVADVSPVLAARRVAVPVLLIHGAADRETPPAHSERVLAALAGPKRLLLVEGAGHNQSLNESSTWTAIDEWVLVDGDRLSLPSRSR